MNSARIFAFVIVIALHVIHGAEGQGALYTMRNANDSNAILITSFGENGTLNYETAIEIPGAKGAGGLGELHSANSLIQAGNFLFCVNAGSDSVTSFTINPADPKEVKLVNTESSGGDYPNTLAISSDLKMLCVANAGEVNKGGVFCYTVDTTTGKITPKTGGLTPFGVETRALPAKTPGLGSPSDILFTHNDKYVTVSIKSINVPEQSGYILNFNVSTSQTGQLDTPIINEVGLIPYSMNVLNPESGGNIIGYTDPGKGQVHTLLFKNGKKQCGKSVDIPLQKNICWSEISPQNKNYYVIDADNRNKIGVVHELSFDIATLKITHIVGLATNRNLLDGRIVSVGVKDILYVIQVFDDITEEHGIFALEVHPSPMKFTKLRGTGPDGKGFPQSMLGMAFFSTKV